MLLQKKIPIIHYLDASACGLPCGWLVVERFRISPKTSKISDKYYNEPETQKTFRSLKAALKHSGGKKKDDMQKLQESSTPGTTFSPSIKTKKKRARSFDFANASRKLRDEVKGLTTEATYLDEPLVQSKARRSTSQCIISSYLNEAEKRGKRKTNIAASLSTTEDKLLAYVFSKLDLSEVLVDYDQDHGIRSDFNTLLPHNWVADTIINLVADQLNTKEKKYKGRRMIQSYLPTIFAENSDQFRRKLVMDLVLDDNNKVKQYILSQLKP